MKTDTERTQAYWDRQKEKGMKRFTVMLDQEAISTLEGYRKPGVKGLSGPIKEALERLTTLETTCQEYKTRIDELEYPIKMDQAISIVNDLENKGVAWEHIKTLLDAKDLPIPDAYRTATEHNVNINDGIVETQTEDDMKPETDYQPETHDFTYSDQEADQGTTDTLPDCHGKDLSKEERDKYVRQVKKQYQGRGCTAKRCKALNDAGILTAGGKEWGKTTLEPYIGRLNKKNK